MKALIFVITGCSEFLLNFLKWSCNGPEKGRRLLVSCETVKKTLFGECPRDRGDIDRIYLLCGTNNVDRILSVPKSDWTNLLSYNQYRVNPSLLEQATWDISNLVAFLHGWAVSATINIVNILPRVSRVRNLVINDLNTHIWDISNRLSYVNVVDTEYDRNLFSDRDSFRKNIYFNGKGSDNVHLNTLGIARLAKHLKYWAHH